MQINIVTVNSGWILQRMAERLYKTNPAVFSISHFPSYTADANFYMDVYNCYHGKTSVLDIGHFTHLHENDMKWTRPHWWSLDFIFHYNKRYYELFKSVYPAEKMKVVPPGEFPSNWGPRKPVIGILQRGGHEGKGFNFMLQLGEWYEGLPDFRWLFVGNDWDQVASLYHSKGASIKHIKDSELDYEGYNTAYEAIDYLLIPSKWEGGPMCYIEAAGKGIPIITADVGFTTDLPWATHVFNPGDLASLVGILDGIIDPLKKRNAEVKALFNWKRYGEIVIDTITQLKVGNG